MTGDEIKQIDTLPKEGKTHKTEIGAKHEEPRLEKKVLRLENQARLAEAREQATQLGNRVVAGDAPNTSHARNSN